jgi:hypothetical protein
LVGGSYLLDRDILPAGALPWVVAALPCLAAVLVLIAYARFLAEADELQRLIQLQALALGFGGTLFVAAGWKLFARAGAPPADLGDLVMAMALFYSLGSLLGWRRYR